MPAHGINKKYLFVCLLPQHKEGDYWTDVELGMKKAAEDLFGFPHHPVRDVLQTNRYSSFINAGEGNTETKAGRRIARPTIPEMTARFYRQVAEREIPYIFIDSNVDSLNPLAFFGQKSDQSGYFAARMAMMLENVPRNRYLQTNQRRPP